ncbi:MAG TPA: DUF4434 domain-containing protein, partial [Ignavibacteriales bacterium]|nr:DUF4434 domain-containing protein [Ignavibacteriales bacterium]
MKKAKINIIINCWLIFFAAALVFPNAVSAQDRKWPIADGTFIQASLCGSWDDKEWQKEFAVMKEAGMHYLIIGAVAEVFPDMPVQTLYPSKLPNTELDKRLHGKDMVDICLRNAEKAGIKVFIGIGMNYKWWEIPSSGFSWLPNQIEFDNKVCDEVWALYKKKYPNAFHGWYWVYEFANVPQMNEQKNGIAMLMNMQLDHINNFEERLPIM